MNLLQDPWLPMKTKVGKVAILPVSHLADPDIVDFALPRADFQGAAYQFVIGLLQTLMAPEDRQQWRQYWQSPPSVEKLQLTLNQAAHAFQLFYPDGQQGPLFMQDFEELNVEPTAVSSLLIEAPGGNTLKLNTDHFIKRGSADSLSPGMAAMALFTLQINAPSGGQGHRTGLRGGGPLTTLILPESDEASLWQKLWLNVISREVFSYPLPDLHSAAVFPWLAKTRTSEKKGSEVYMQDKDVHPLQMYWPMPRRIRLLVAQQSALCQLSGQQTDYCVNHYLTQNFGVNYSGTWAHPLTPYRFNPKKPEEAHFTVKGQPGGIGYRQWHTLIFEVEEDGYLPAKVIAVFGQMHGRREKERYRLWAFGFDMDNMKARGWYSVQFPLFDLEVKVKDAFLAAVKIFIELATEANSMLRSQIKAAWFERPKEAKGDVSQFEKQFWQSTEAAFFQVVGSLLEDLHSESGEISTKTAQFWLGNIQRQSLGIFDQVVMTSLQSDRSTKRKIEARMFLSGWLYKGKAIKNFKTLYQIPETTKEQAA
ncbi:type I-E CRISPR-associated protein Cse1/CasA [Bowmanella dokdonensis]|uniref:Type I-E CRISPR-associated protein Cse1/CasA n=1 Tax=Bowmanella dokdonensis TaxID=751969 RepID=A0A939DPX1_9ALTE|nr:type I-E CRISPR-associated protein Cse1/CasA [Bowmanella dokdonensis]MBN7826493.1 type I-E CRISPR-associated protein Cse1/CasA [Bowmanella dokdonensis]